MKYFYIILILFGFIGMLALGFVGSYMLFTYYMKTYESLLANISIRILGAIIFGLLWQQPVSMILFIGVLGMLDIIADKYKLGYVWDKK